MNWWLMLLAFVLGAVITWFARVGTVSREVQTQTAGGLDLPDVDAPDISGTAAGLGAGAVGLGAAGVAAAKGGFGAEHQVGDPVAPESVAPESVAPEPVAPESVAPEPMTADADLDAPSNDGAAVDAPAAEGADWHTHGDPASDPAGDSAGEPASDPASDSAGDVSAAGPDSGTGSSAEAADSSARGFADTGSADTASASPVSHPTYGDGSAVPNDDGSGPAGWNVKGNENSMLYHTDQSPYFKGTRAEVWFRDEATAGAAGFTRWDQRNRSAVAPLAAVEPDPHPTYGAGASAPAEDGSGPSGWNVKGNEDSMLYHSEDSPHYGRTKAEVWFRDEATAQAAGFKRWDSNRRK